VYVILAEGVTNATPAVVELLVAVGGVPNVTATPPAEYPVPETSLEAEYAVVEALTVAVVRYSAALKLSVAPDARTGAVPKLWVAVINSPIKLVVIAWVFAMVGSLIKRCGFYRRTYICFERYMHRAMY
jgi:hypothetical protein